MIINEETGEGYCDIMIKIRKKKMDALKQIELNKYKSGLIRDGITKILKYGIVFYKKECKVVLNKD